MSLNALPEAFGPLMLDVAGVELTQEERERLCHPGVGGVIFFARNFVSVAQIHRLIDEIHELRNPKLLIAVDQEGGRVQRFKTGLTRLPPAAFYGRLAEQDLDLACKITQDAGWLMASELRLLGVDFSFAPVLDLGGLASQVIGDRALANEPSRVAQLAQAWCSGVRQAGMACVGKHFPGHGGVVEDSHLEMPLDSRSLNELLAADLVPFQQAIDQGLEAVMPAHVLYPAVDQLTAGFSRIWLQEILRGRLGFNGCIFSDDLSMQGAAEIGSYAKRAEKALAAGCDMVLACNNPQGAQEILDFMPTAAKAESQSRLAALRARDVPIEIAQQVEVRHALAQWMDKMTLKEEKNV